MVLSQDPEEAEDPGYLRILNIVRMLALIVTQLIIKITTEEANDQTIKLIKP